MRLGVEVEPPLLVASPPERSLGWRWGRLETDWPRSPSYCGTDGGRKPTRDHMTVRLTGPHRADPACEVTQSHAACPSDLQYAISHSLIIILREYLLL